MRKVNQGDRVLISAVCGPHVREIGSVDPLADMERYLELESQAEQAAATLNALNLT